MWDLGVAEFIRKIPHDNLGIEETLLRTYESLKFLQL